MTDEPSGLALAAELEDLRARLVEAKEVLRAIHNGEVDAVVVTGERGEHVYTLMGADRIYRQLIETMSEGAATLTADGVILYCNVRLAEMLERPLDQLLGTALGNYLPPADQQAVDALLAQARTEPSRREINLRTSEGRLVPVYLSASRLESEGAEIVFCLVLTDLREQKSHEHIVAAERLGRSILDQAAEAIVVCDERGRIIRASQAAQVLCDGSPLLRPFDEACPLRTDTSSPFHLTRVLQGATLRNVDVALERQGRTLHLILNAGPLLDGQQVLGCVVTLTDITERAGIEMALRQRQRDLSDAQRIAHIGSWLHALTGGMTWSDETYRIYGVSPDTLAPNTESFIDLIHPEDRPAMRAWMTACLEGKRPGELEHRTILPDGTVRHISGRGELRCDAEGTPLLMGGTVQDITERTRAEAALRESEERFRMVFEKGAYGVVIASVFEGKFIEANAAFCRMLGYTAEELTQLTFKDVTHPDDRPRDIEALKQLWEGQTSYYRAEKRYLKKNGDTVWGALAASMIRGTDGKALYSLAMIQDITERKQAEAALRENELLTRRVVDHLPQRIFVKDLNSAYVFCNSSYAQDLGIEPHQIVGKDDFAFFPQELAERYRADDRAVMTDGTTKEIDERYQTAGEEQSIHTVKIPYRNQQGKITGVLGIFHDITERKRAEEEKAKLEAQLQQAQKMESVGRLAGGVAHDFNNMLGVILGHAELAMAQVDPAQLLHADLTEIRDAAVRSANLTRQLLAFARQQTVSPIVLDLNEAVAGMLSMLQRLISEDIDLTWQPAADLWPVNVDPSQIDQILANLCVNAGDAIAGVGKMTIETGNSTLDENYCAGRVGCVPGQYVLLAVSDDGIGMDTETLSHIFEPFFTTKAVGKGTGLGLATVYGIVNQNNGFIDVDSEPNRGTTFKIYLPRHVDKASKARQALTEGAARPLQRGHETILLVEDELAILTLTRRMLERQGYTVLAANTPGEAISLAREHTGEIDLLITDVIMPEMNGRVLAKNLLSVHPFLKRLFMSGYTADVIAHRGVLEQGVPFIQKPFSREDLATKVRDALDALD